MNTNKPHDIIEHQELEKLPDVQKSNYTRITADEAEYLKDKSPEERELWLYLPFSKRLKLILRSCQK